MRKLIKLLLIPLLIIITLVSIIGSVTKQVEEQVAALYGEGEPVELACEGTYTNFTIDLHIYSSTGRIDFETSGGGIAGAYELSQGNIKTGDFSGSIDADAKVSEPSFTLIGKLFSYPIELSGSAKDGIINARGYVIIPQNYEGEGGEAGKATYVGVDDTDTDFSRRILQITSRWSNSYNPYFNGYGGLCETWCADVYRAAGFSYAGACCANTHGIRQAHKSGKIPKGALIFNGTKPGGGEYINDTCPACGRCCGHVAIYVGNGYVVGSQVPYRMSVDTWISFFGYGGWSKQ